jgi:hypothetical protein
MKAGNVMVFGGFQGSIEMSMEDNCLFGRILNIKDVVTYEAQNPQDLETEFKKAVVDYFKIAGREDLIRALDMAIELAHELGNQIDAMGTWLETNYPTPTPTAS